MAQIELSLGSGLPLEVVRELPGIVNEVHYGADDLKPGDITMAVVRTDDVESVATITEGSENWPKDDSGLFLPLTEMCDRLNERKARIYEILGNIAYHDTEGLEIIEANGIYPVETDESDRGLSVTVRVFNGEITDGEKRRLKCSYNQIAKLYRLEKPEGEIIFPEMDRELSVSDANYEIECKLPRTDKRFESNPEYLDEVARSIAVYMSSPAVPVNCFIQGDKGTGWGKAS